MPYKNNNFWNNSNFFLFSFPVFLMRDGIPKFSVIDVAIIHSIHRNSGSRSSIVWKITSNIYILHRSLPEAWFQRSPLIGNPLVKVKREMDRSQEWRTEVLPATRLGDHHPLSPPFSLFCVALQPRWELLSSSREEFSSLVVNDRARINLVPLWLVLIERAREHRDSSVVWTGE